LSIEIRPRLGEFTSDALAAGPWLIWLSNLSFNLGDTSTSGASKAEKLRRLPLKLNRCGRETGEGRENLVVLPAEVKG